MQIVITVVAKPGSSLRDVIVRDSKLEDYNLRVAAMKDRQRANGWSKLHGEGVAGAVNIQWLAHSSILLCRVVNRAGGRPGKITGYLTDYLLSRHRKRIISVHITSA
jgi:hypothetical protein